MKRFRFGGFGWTPIVIPIQPNIDWRKKDIVLKEQKSIQKHLGTIGFTLFLEPSLCKIASDEARSSASESWVMANSHLLKSFRESKTAAAYFEEYGKYQATAPNISAPE